MPLYKVRSKEHHEIVIEFQPMSWAEFQEFLSEHPDYEPIISAPAFVRVN